MPDKPLKFLTVEQVAEILEVSIPTVYRLAKKELPCYKVGGSFKFKQDEVEGYLVRNRSVHDSHICPFCLSSLKSISDALDPKVLTLRIECRLCGKFRIRAEAIGHLYNYPRADVIRDLKIIREKVKASPNTLFTVGTIRGILARPYL